MFAYILAAIVNFVKVLAKRVSLSRLFSRLIKKTILRPFSQAIFNRAADPAGSVTQNIFVRRGLGREPQQAKKHPPPAGGSGWFFLFMWYQADARIGALVYT